VVLAGANETEQDIQDEIQALAMGQLVPVKPNQNHQLHIQLKTQAFASISQNGGVELQIEDAFRQNIDGHAAMMATQGSEAQALGGQGGFPTEGVQQMEAPNPQEENLGASPQGTGAFSV